MRENPNQKSTHEHTIPFKVLRDKLINLDEITFESASGIFDRFHVVTIISDEEDQMLKDAGLNSKMPIDWDGKNPFSRYESVGITL